jgi:hypothetical protein
MFRAGKNQRGKNMLLLTLPDNFSTRSAETDKNGLQSRFTVKRFFKSFLIKSAYYNFLSGSVATAFC